MPPDGCDRVLTARRVVTAAWPEQGGDPPLVEPNRRHQDKPDHGGHRAHTSRSRAESRSAPSSLELAAAAAGSARTTTTAPTGSRANRGASWWRSRRLTRVRMTAPPTALLTTSPARGGGAGVAVETNTCTTSSGRPARRPRRTARAKSAGRRNRWGAGSMAGSGRQLGAALAPTSSEDGAAGAGAHAQPEAMGLRAPPVVRLVGALRHWRTPNAGEARPAGPRRLSSAREAPADRQKGPGTERPSLDPEGAGSSGQHGTPALGSRADDRWTPHGTDRRPHGQTETPRLPALWMTPCERAACAVSVRPASLPRPRRPRSCEPGAVRVLPRSAHAGVLGLRHIPSQLPGTPPDQAGGSRPYQFAAHLHKLWTKLWTTANSSTRTRVPTVAHDRQKLRRRSLDRP